MEIENQPRLKTSNLNLILTFNMHVQPSKNVPVWTLSLKSY